MNVDSLPDPVILEEHCKSAPILLSEVEREALARLAPGVSVAPADEGGLFVLDPGNNVGAIQLGKRRFELRPKIAVRRLLFLLSYSMDPSRWRQQGFDFAQDTDLFEAVAPGFAYQVEEALRGGPLLGYRQREDALQTVRGRIRFDEQLRSRFGLLPPIECRFDEFTDDIEANRLLRAAIARLGSIRIRDPRTRTRLASLAPAFANVTPVTYDPRALPEPRFDRLSERYRRPVELARLILRSHSIDARSGGIGGDAFLVNLATVFENFVLVALRESLRLSERRFPAQARGRTLHLDAGCNLGLRPDLSWWEGGACRFIGDVKYKRTPPTPGVQHPDMYQLLAYTTATELPWGLLVYAAGESPERSYRIAAAGKEIEVRTLDLDRDPASVLAQVDAIASRVRERAAGSATAAAARLQPASSH
ncbi:MAG: 5-methylcytosine-specific restriction enzyme subunit McrC [Solirubrobacterales bacterium]|jgi:5-methylcytosine-specific restriction enzyme subunit McrC|nr:5-methylcytosine-specific restriction enzyme subunit McrC [Solirubrobacterales bacterium]